jgi:hypothetical protein
VSEAVGLLVDDPIVFGSVLVAVPIAWALVSVARVNGAVAGAALLVILTIGQAVSTRRAAVAKRVMVPTARSPERVL